MNRSAAKKSSACEGVARINPLERKRREALLRDIERRIERFGEHEARSHADRARQFMPFAALKGYEDMAKSREFVPLPRHVPTAEESRVFSETVAELSKGDIVRASYYENGRHITIEGAVAGKSEELRTMRIGKTDIAFDLIESIERPTGLDA